MTVRRIDPQFNTVAQPKRIANVDTGGAGYVATQGNDVRVAPSSGLVARLDPRTGAVAQTIDPNSGPTGVAVGANAVWVTDSTGDTVTRIDPTGLLTPIAVGQGPSGIAVGAGGVWVADTLDNSVVRIDPTTRAVTTTIPVGQGPVGVAVGAGSVWVANGRDGTVTRIDSTTNTPKTIPVGGSPQEITVSGGRVWVTVDPQVKAVDAAPEGGIGHLDLQNDVDHMDPALAYSPLTWRLLYATCANLLNYPDKPAPVGSQLEPEVAESLPARSADGKTYTFTIRKGFRFSPPSDQPVTAETFRYTIERTLDPRMKSPVQGYMRDVVGVDSYLAGKTRHIPGVVVHGNKLIIRLQRPVPDLPARLAMPFFCAVPVGTPIDPKGVSTIPSAGPYRVTSYVPGQAIVLERNPNYRGSRPHHLRRIEVTVGVSKQKTANQVEAGAVDYAMDGVAPTDEPRLAARYGPGSPLAKKGAQRFFVSLGTAIDFFALNTHRLLFSDARVRRAVGYAIDRTALARLGNPYTQTPDQPTDDYLPPGVPGFQGLKIYPLRPDLAAARRLAGTRQRTAILYTCNVSPCDRLAQVVKANLAAIGVDVQVKAFGFNALFSRITRPGEPFEKAGLLRRSTTRSTSESSILLRRSLGPGATSRTEGSTRT